jgi:hypothetical protein
MAIGCLVAVLLLVGLTAFIRSPHLPWLEGVLAVDAVVFLLFDP